MAADLEPVFLALKAVLERAAPEMPARAKDDADYARDAPWDCNGKPMRFAWVRKTGYVSFHLMPVYTHPELAARVSPALRKRMQGKSCFNFKTVDPVLFEELEALTAEGARLYAEPLHGR